MVGDQSHRIATAASPAHSAAGAVYDDLGHGLLVALVVVLGLIALLVILTCLEPRPRTTPSPVATNPGPVRTDRPPVHGHRDQSRAGATVSARRETRTPATR